MDSTFVLYLFMGLMILTSVLQMSGFIKIPPGTFAATLSPIAAGTCRQGGAGIAELYIVPYADIDTVTWDAVEQATAISMVVSKTWTKFSFERGTAFFNQEKQAPGSNINFVQTISINFPNNDKDTRWALKLLDSCCEVVAFVVDNQGKHHLAGIESVAAGGTASRALGLKTGAGSYNTGADPAADQNLRIVTLTCNSSYEAPYTDVAVSTLALT